MLCFFSVGFATGLRLDVATNKSTYELGEQVMVSGTLTLNATPVSDGLVAMQVDSPDTRVTVFRTLTTGTGPLNQDWPVEIVGFYTSDSYGYPKSSFKVGTTVGFTVSLRNNALSDYTVKVPVYTQYANNLPFDCSPVFVGTISSGQTINATSSIDIPSDAVTGTTYAYASIISDYIDKGGYAYSPEKATTFLITSSSFGSSALGSEILDTGNSGSFNTTFGISQYGGMLGYYSVYATSRYSFYWLSNQTTFNARLSGDITGPQGVPDGAVDIRDVSKVSRAYGSVPGDPKWDPKADLNNDGTVDIRDVAIVSKNYGKYGIFP
jgi:hypothetical protein